MYSLPSMVVLYSLEVSGTSALVQLGISMVTVSSPSLYKYTHSVVCTIHCPLSSTHDSVQIVNNALIQYYSMYWSSWYLNVY